MSKLLSKYSSKEEQRQYLHKSRIIIDYFFYVLFVVVYVFDWIWNLIVKC